MFWHVWKELLLTWIMMCFWSYIKNWSDYFKVATAVKVWQINLCYSASIKVVCYLIGSILEHKAKVSTFQEDRQRHKDDAQNALQYYRDMVISTQSEYTKITYLIKKQNAPRLKKSSWKGYRIHLVLSLVQITWCLRIYLSGANLHNQQKLTIRWN